MRFAALFFASVTLALAGCASRASLPVREPRAADIAFDALQELLFPSAEFGRSEVSLVTVLRERYVGATPASVVEQFARMSDLGHAVPGARVRIEEREEGVLVTYSVSAPDALVGSMLWFMSEDGLIRTVAIDGFDQPKPNCGCCGQEEEKTAEPSATDNPDDAQRI